MAQEADLLVLGYVSMGYGERDPAEVDDYYAWYGVGGIFFYEASTDCARSGYYGA